jgi:two-component system, NarL family, response regulator LiaR
MPVSTGDAKRRRIRVGLVDDHHIVRGGVAAFLSAHDDIEIVGQAPNGEAALNHAAAWRADVILMDVQMPGGIDGIETTRRLRALVPDAQIVILSSFSDDARLIGAMRAGALTYVQKEAKPAVLLNTVRQAALGHAALEPELMARLAEAKSTRYRDVLTGRERDVLRGIAAGLTNIEIAAQLVIGEETVKTHVASLLRKLELSHRTQAAIFALKHGLDR